MIAEVQTLEESPGSTEAWCRVTPGGGDPRDSATENRPPAYALTRFKRVRVKRCGKSAPRSRQRERHGKPRQEQDQIGMAYGLFPARHPGRSREASGDGRPRGMVIQPARVDRTRLIGPLAHSLVVPQQQIKRLLFVAPLCETP